MKASAGLASGLQRRLLLLLMVPLLVLAALNSWFDFRSADTALAQQDRRLSSLVPLLADSVVAGGDTPLDSPVMLTVPAIGEFLGERGGLTAFAIVDAQGHVLTGADWLTGVPLLGHEPEFTSEEFEGTIYRVVSQRMQTVAGELTMRLADGSDPRQQWLRLLWFKVALPNLILAVAGIFAVNWAVRIALRPLIELRDAVEHRSPEDLSAIDVAASPEEVRPLVTSLNRLFELVNAQAESQRRFVADAAHQLRTPLAGLQAQVEAWAQAVSPDRYMQNDLPAHTESAQSAINEGADQILKLRDATRRTSQLASQLLALSRADARTATTVPMQRVDLKQLCEVVLEHQLDAASVKGIDLGLDAHAVHATGYEWLLREVLVNLVDNAVRYTPAGGHVTLRCGYSAAPEHSAFLEVEDDGPGVPEPERARLLERFYRVPGTPGEGNGLGLAIADEIARVHHSTLQISRGAKGAGLRVTLCLPAQPAA